MRLWTLGHSTRPLAELVDLCRGYDLRRIVDVRRYPASRRYPHFGTDTLAAALAEVGIGYTWLSGLGGRRSRRKGSPHTAWRVAAFAGYADHMDTVEFRTAAAELVQLAEHEAVAIMCAEAWPMSCHRRLIADWLVAHGAEVIHILDAARAVVHELPPFARIEDGRVIYDGAHPQLSLGV
jgi:uncharacterized protein (DUF488 family)